MGKWWLLVRIWLLVMDSTSSEASDPHGLTCSSRSVPTREGLEVDCSAKQLLRVPDDLPEQTAHLDLSLNNLQRLKAQAFVHIPQVLSINLTRSNISYLDSKTFSRLDHLLELYLPCNPVLIHPGLPDDVFHGLSNLHALHIWTDQTAEMSFSAIDKIESLKHVAVTPNIDSIPSELLSLPNLKSLTLAFREIHNLTYELLKPLSTMALEEIAFHACEIHHVDKEAFSNFTSLYLLNFACNFELQLNNVIDSISTSAHVNVTELIVDLVGSEQGNILGPEDTPKCRRAWSNLQRLSARCIGPLMVTNVLNFVKCWRGVKALSLSSNTILPLGVNANIRDQISRILKEFHLVSLDLSYLNAVPNPVLERRKEMCFSYLANSIPSNQEMLPHYTESEPGCMQQPITFEPVAHPECISSKTSTYGIPPCLNYITFQGSINPIFAARKCAVFPPNILETIIASDVKGHPPGILEKPIYGLTNLKTADLRNSDIRYISGKYFTSSSVSSLRTLLLADNLLGQSNNSFLSSQQRFSNLEVLDLAGNQFSHFDTDSFSNFPSLRHLYLARNQLKEVNFLCNITKSVQFLDVAENKLITLPKNMTGKLDDLSEYNTITVNLSGNPWLCSCGTLHFIKWIQDTSVTILDINNVKCLAGSGDISINEVDIESFQATCQSRNLKIISGTTVASLLIGLAIAAYLVYRLRWKIRWRYYKMRYISQRRSEYLLDDMSTRSSFNAYIIFSMEDDVVRHWVAHVLCPRVEGEWNQGPLFLPGLRDDIGGAADVDNITEGLMSSQTAIWILSPAFFDDRHCEMAAHFAFHHLGAKRNLLVVRNRRLSHYKFPRHFLNLLNKKNGIPRMTYSDDTDDAERVFWTRLREFLSEPSQYRQASCELYNAP